MTFEINSSQPIWKQLLSKIKERIVTGEYAPGSHFPTVRELAEEAGVNPNTMQRALSRLEEDGLVITNRTAGRVVTDDIGIIQKTRDTLADECTDAFLNKMSALGFSKEEMKKHLEKHL